MNTNYSQEAQDAATAHITELTNSYSRQLGGLTEGAFGSQLVSATFEIAGAARKLGRMLRDVADRMTLGDEPVIRVWAQRVPGHPEYTMVAGYVLRARILPG